MLTLKRFSPALGLALLAAVFSPLASAQPLPANWQAVAGTPTIKAIKAAPRLPTSAVSDDGATVRVTDVARVIAGGDDVIDIMETLGLGDRVFAAPDSAVTEAGRKAPRHFLFNRTTGAEGVLSLDGTLFLGNSLRRHGKLSETLRATALPAVVVDDLQPAPQKIRKVAAVFGLAAEGETLAKTVQQQLDEAAAIGKPLTKRARVIHVSATGGGGRPTVGGKDTAAAQLIRLAGGINIGDAANTGDYTALSNEGVVAAMPDVVLITRSDLELFGGEAGLWRSYPTLKQTPAGAANRVWVMPDQQLKIVGSQSGTGAIALAQAFKAFAANAK
ncbi:hemin ABC transporter substrate-binding protein [Hydrogenophaga sp.]|uniref:heme/hemin ABC transporter substrate-binding protein n=1 Tax=Hydrogenophaga sp. TaxID=1904254 RepID=UPI00271F865C|nr:ABC transporter substrate-binding protein [Hydrogenophaga sp.]MDO9436930.1 ABC transporter substrate-binding protein [Hydrogenophaga sp.]